MSRALRSFVTWFGIVLLAGTASYSVPSQPFGPQQTAVAAAPVASPQRALLDKYCVTCHNQRARTAGLSLDNVDVDNVGVSAEVWEKVVGKVSSGAMPPPSMPRPDQNAINGFVSSLETSLDRAATASPNPGRVAIHRLNRAEYANAIRDLLAVEIDVPSLLSGDDAGEEGFDNMAGALSVSPALVDRYLSAARKISRVAIGDPTIPSAFAVYAVPKMMVQDSRLSEDLPFASRGGIAIHHRFPVDGEYLVKIKLRGQLYDYIMGLGRPHPLEIRLDGERLKVFTVGGDAPGRPAPASFAGNTPGDPEWEQYMHDADAKLEVRFPAKAGLRVVGVSFAEFTPEPEGVLQPPLTQADGAPYTELYDGNPEVETVTIGGPYNVKGPGDTPSRRAIFVCRPKGTADDQPCAKRILSTLARHAYRRPVSEGDVETLLGFYEAGRKQGGFESGIQSALIRILVDPEFLFRIEADPPNRAPGTIYRLSDLALASRLSFFLWSSIPDEELLDLAIRGRLREPAVMEKQVQRMFADPRAKALIDNFADQWLSLPELRGAAPNPDRFPDWDENLREAFERETELFLESQLRADRSVVDLVSADYTFVNERLARHYQIPNVYGNGFRRVTFTNGERGGLLGQGSILTVTSYADRTSPVLRGKWLLDTILGMPPPPPPPNVEGLKDTPQGKPASMRERMEQHRKNPSCATCHAMMDPLGFSLENFDPVGRWRSTTDGAPIDTAGSFPDGTKFEGVAGLRKLLLSRREQFADTLTEKLLTYALGRGVEYYDLPAVRKIVRDAAARDYRWSAIIEGIAKSVPFQMSVVGDVPSQTAKNRAHITRRSGE